MQALRRINQSGVVMNISGFALVYFMRATQKSGSSISQGYKKAQ